MNKESSKLDISKKLLRKGNFGGALDSIEKDLKRGRKSGPGMTIRHKEPPSPPNSVKKVFEKHIEGEKNSRKLVTLINSKYPNIKRIEKRASINKYLTKIARIGDIGKALIKTKMAPALTGMSRAGVSKLEALSRASAGSKVKSGIFSTGEKAQHMDKMKNLGPRLLSGMDASQANRITAVAARAKRMNVI